MESEEDLQGVAQVLEEHRRQHVSLLQQRQREREVMTAKLKERIERLPKRDTNLEDSSARIPVSINVSHHSPPFGILYTDGNANIWVWLLGVSDRREGIINVTLAFFLHLNLIL